jgi:hypothetical protein
MGLVGRDEGVRGSHDGVGCDERGGRGRAGTRDSISCSYLPMHLDLARRNLCVHEQRVRAPPRVGVRGGYGEVVARCLRRARGRCGSHRATEGATAGHDGRVW